jgi:hypothetical protein
MLKKANLLTRPTPARQDAPLPRARPQRLKKGEVEVKAESWQAFSASGQAGRKKKAIASIR